MKRLIYFMCVLFVVSISAISLNFQMNNSKLSPLALENIEALASYESGSGNGDCKTIATITTILEYGKRMGQKMDLKCEFGKGYTCISGIFYDYYDAEGKLGNNIQDFTRVVMCN